MTTRCGSVALDPAHDGLSSRQSGLLASYLLNRHRGTATLRRLIRQDMVRFAEMRARKYAADLAEVLKRVDSRNSQVCTAGIVQSHTSRDSHG